jgi:hypothetical protein
MSAGQFLYTASFSLSTASSGQYETIAIHLSGVADKHIVLVVLNAPIQVH